jgi:hypothetical protein
MPKVHISQSDNYKKSFGIAYRSSTIFYFKKDKNFSTFINFMDYWKIKKSVKVMIIASLRDMSGKLIFREQLYFDKGNVINYSPKIEDAEFEGSLEVEAIANENLGIPFAAILVIYEAENSVSMVHGYTRTYTPHEIEEGRIIDTGEEAGLVCRDDKDVRSFLIGHNGIYKQKPQKIKLWISNSSGKTLEKEIEFKELMPYETFKIIPANYFKNLVEFLDNKPGNCAISYRLSGGFTRLVVGNETIKGDEFQVLHSNFNYGRHDPGYIKGNSEGYYSYPFTPLHDRQVTHVDPFCATGKFEISSNTKKINFISKKREDIQMEQEVLKINRLDGDIPARINIVFSAFLKGAKCKLPMESARGFYHAQRPPKHRLWMAASIGKKYRSKIIIHSLTDLYGPVEDSKLEIILYKEDTFETITKFFGAKEIEKFQEGFYVDELFPEVSNKKENEICQLWVQSASYGGHQAYTTLEAKNGSASIEHNY